MDVYGHVAAAMRARNYMVQTGDQYVFAPRGACWGAACGHPVPARSLHAPPEALGQVPPGSVTAAAGAGFEVGRGWACPAPGAWTGQLGRPPGSPA